MATRVIQLVESLTPEPGSIALSLRDLDESLRAAGLESETTTAAGPFDAAALSDRLAQADLVHIHGWGYPLARRAATVARRNHRPYLISPFGALGEAAAKRHRIRDRIRGWMGENRLVRSAAALTAINEVEAHDLRKRHGHHNVVELPCGIRLDRYEHNAPTAQPPDAPNGPCLLLLAPVDPVEGYVPLLKALAELGDAADNWHVVIAGPERAEWRKMLEAAVRRKGGEGRVIFTNPTDDDAQCAWLTRADILAAPSLEVRCPTPVLQGLAAGRPVLASHYVVPTGLEQAVDICVPARGELKNALRRMLTMDDQDRAETGRRARDDARDMIDWSTVAGRYADLYQSLI